jgi:hypothetical protein
MKFVNSEIKIEKYQSIYYLATCTLLNWFFNFIGLILFDTGTIQHSSFWLIITNNS